MENQGRLLEMLQEMKEIAASQQNKLTREEINRYLGGQLLSEEQFQAVYQYLGENGIAVEGYKYTPAPEEPSLDKGSEDSRREPGSRARENLQRYREELSGISGNPEEEEPLIISWLKGEDSLKNRIIELSLGRVLELAGKYGKRPVPQEEVIAEGNVGLLTAMGIVERNRGEYLRQDGTLDREKFFGTLDMEVVHAMECYIDEETASRDWENTMLAKRNLLHEAEKYLAEEMGRVPDVEELSEYTKIAPEEIRNIMALSKETRGRG